MKEAVYIETSVVSYLTARRSSDTQIAAHQELTQEWWMHRAARFELVVSELVLEEAGGGDPIAASDRLKAISQARVLTMREEVFSLADSLVESGLIPRTSGADALHIALAATGGVDYLLTWNCRHIANALRRNQIAKLVMESGFECPVICTPEELIED